jgi:HNH endonuclease
MQRTDITPELLFDLFFIDFTAGSMKWRSPPKRGKRLFGTEAGCNHENGWGLEYCCISIKNRLYKRSRLIYLAYHGEWPEPTVDHWDRNSLNDSIANLRPASRALQTDNRTVHRKLHCGEVLPRGVFAQNGKFRAKISHNGTRINLGSYATAMAAHDAYSKKREELRTAHGLPAPATSTRTQP